MVFNIFDPGFRADPYPIYARFRAHEPVHLGRPPTPGDHDTRWWYLFDYETIARILKDHRFGRSFAPALDEAPPPIPPEEREPFWDMYAQWTLALEPPEHTRQRTLLNHAFTARVVQALRPRIRARAGSLLHELTQSGQFDVVADYAFPLTLAVICELIGIPPGDRDRIKEWSLIIAAVLDYKRTWDIMTAGNRMAQDFSAYLAAIIHNRRNSPQEDLISRLLSGTGDGQQIDETELIALCVMLLFAGHETTVNLISAGTFLLLSHPDQLALFRARSDLAEIAVDEFLRLHSPIQATSRIAYADVEIGGRLIRRGESVTLLLGSANRDPAVFTDPDRLDITRRPNRHLAFGRGIHYCLGAPLAVAQGGIALRALLNRKPGLRLVATEPAWSETFGFRGLQELNVAWDLS
jgi:cytochrome P450